MASGCVRFFCLRMFPLFQRATCSRLSFSHLPLSVAGGFASEASQGLGYPHFKVRHLFLHPSTLSDKNGRRALEFSHLTDYFLLRAVAHFFLIPKNVARTVAV